MSRSRLDDMREEFQLTADLEEFRLTADRLDQIAHRLRVHAAALKSELEWLAVKLQDPETWAKRAMD